MLTHYRSIVNNNTKTNVSSLPPSKHGRLPKAFKFAVDQANKEVISRMASAAQNLISTSRSTLRAVPLVPRGSISVPPSESFLSSSARQPATADFRSSPALQETSRYPSSSEGDQSESEERDEGKRTAPAAFAPPPPIDTTAAAYESAPFGPASPPARNGGGQPDRKSRARSQTPAEAASQTVARLSATARALSSRAIGLLTPSSSGPQGRERTTLATLLPDTCLDDERRRSHDVPSNSRPSSAGNTFDHVPSPTAAGVEIGSPLARGGTSKILSRKPCAATNHSDNRPAYDHGRQLNTLTYCDGAEKGNSMENDVTIAFTGAATASRRTSNSRIKRSDGGAQPAPRGAQTPSPWATPPGSPEAPAGIDDDVSSSPARGLVRANVRQRSASAFNNNNSAATASVGSGGTAAARRASISARLQIMKSMTGSPGAKGEGSQKPLPPPEIQEQQRRISLHQQQQRRQSSSSAGRRSSVQQLAAWVASGVGVNDASSAVGGSLGSPGARDVGRDWSPSAIAHTGGVGGANRSRGGGVGALSPLRPVEYTAMQEIGSPRARGAVTMG